MEIPKKTVYSADLPDTSGHFGVYGGRYIPETLLPAVEELTARYLQLRGDAEFQAEYRYYLKHFVGRETPLYLAGRLTSHAGGAKIYLKREDLCHTGAHKINNTVGQVLIAKRMGKRRIIAETGAGQHGVATATVCALFGIQCIVYMGEEDMERQSPNVDRMKLLGAEVRPVSSGSKTLKDATSEAIRDWVTNVETTFYIIGSVVGMHPYPMMVRDFQSVIGDETRRQIMEAEGRLPNVIVACVGGGSNSMGIFYPFLNDVPGVKLVGVEAAGLGIETGKHAAALAMGARGVLHGAMHVPSAGRERTGSAGALYLCRVGLSRCRTRALLPQGQQAGRVRIDHRHRSTRRHASPFEDRRDYSCIGIIPCNCPCSKNRCPDGEH